MVKVITAQEGIAAGGFHLEETVADLENGDIKGAAAQVVHGDGFVFAFVQTVSQGRSGRLIDDSEHFQTRDFSRVFGGVALGVIEVRGHGNDCLGDRLAEIGFGVVLDFCQNHGGHLGRGVLFVAQGHAQISVGSFIDLIRHAGFGALHLRVIITASHKALDRKDGVFGINNGLVARHAPDQPFAVLVYGDNGGH